MRMFTLLLATLTLQAQPVYDLLLQGGHVIDPKNRISRVMDVAISGGRIAKVAANIPASQSRKTIDVKGLYVVPGLIDMHAHLYNRPGNPAPRRNQSVQPDAVSFRSGVTTTPLPHGFSYDLRMQMYNWFAKWIKGE